MPLPQYDLAVIYQLEILIFISISPTASVDSTVMGFKYKRTRVQSLYTLKPGQIIVVSSEMRAYRVSPTELNRP